MIKQATISDIPVLTKYALSLYNDSSANELSDEFEKSIKNKNAAIFLACEDNVCIGFAQCQLRHDYVEGTVSTPVGYLEGIFVEEKYRRKGYAKALLFSCEKWAKEQGCTEFASDCELVNTDGYNFHCEMGFKEVNRIICFAKTL